MKPLLLIILDGWGVRDVSEHNAVKKASLPHFNQFLSDYPWTTLKAHGEAVGLMPGVMGNSEVGHLHMGAGRIVDQLLTRIHHEIDDGSFYQNETLVRAVETCKKGNGSLHVMGLLSDAGVHSHQRHIEALLELAKRHQLKNVYIHAFMDGRDTSPKSGSSYLEKLCAFLYQTGIGRVATLSGRYYAMDRDKRWDRTEKAYQALVHGNAEHTQEHPTSLMKRWYETDDPSPGFGDEFTPPTVFLDEATNEPIGLIKDGDVVLHANFRPDRARQLTQALTDPNFREFERDPTPKLANYTCLASYSDDFDLPVAFGKEPITNTLPAILSRQGVKQYRVAETEKYAHVTYFFNCGEEEPYQNEERKLVSSNREVETYDHAPEMRAREVTAEVIAALTRDQFDFYVVNFANPDMVGHTGKEDAVIEAIETIDECLDKIVQSILQKDGTVMITADHGNCEEMVDSEGHPHTQHTLNPVPFILIGNQVRDIKLRPGGLSDIAPTILQLMKIPQPKEMTGESLIV